LYNTRSRGYAVTVDQSGTVEEDTITCAHCNSVVFLKPREISGSCRMCYGFLCPTCVDAGTCTPFEKKLERMEARERLLRAAAGG
jgi:hypothetical protein